MHIENRGAIAAILVLAGIDLPSSFNIDQGAFDRALDARKLERPHFDADALRFLATFDAAKDLSSTLTKRKEEATAALGANATPDKVSAFERIKARRLQELRDEQAKAAEDEVANAALKAAEEEFNEEVATTPSATAENANDADAAKTEAAQGKAT